MRLFTYLVLFSFSSLPEIVNAQTATALQARFLLDVGIHYGGDDIATVYFEDGNEQEMLAGQGLTLAIGGEFSLADFDYIFVRSSIGLKYSTTAADNANIMFLRYPLNLMGYVVPFEGIRVGIGTTSHLGAVLKGDGFFPDIDYDSSFGPRFEIGYKWVALTYESLTFTDELGQEYDGSSFGLSFSSTFPR